MNATEAALRRETRRDDLFTILVGAPDGLTIDDIASGLDCNMENAKRAVRDLRLLLGEDTDINVTCTPRGQGQRWVYELVGGTNPATRGWVDNRTGDTEARLRTIRAVIASAVAATDGRSVDGRRARRIERGLRHMIEDLDALIETDHL